MDNVNELNKQAVALQEEVWMNTDLWSGNFTKAVKLLKEALVLEPDNVTTLTNLGAALCDSGKHQEAKQHLKKAISLGSKDRHTYFNMGVACKNTRSDHNEYFQRASQMERTEGTWEAYFDPHAH